MTYPEHYLLSYGGDFTSDPAEVWVNNIRFAQDDNVDLATLQNLDSAQQLQVATDFGVKIQTHMASGLSGYSANVRLKWVKFNRIDSLGHYADQSDSNTVFYPSPYFTGAGASTHPLSAAVVMTFLTTAERGPGSRGRVYVPHPAVPTASPTFRIAGATLTSLTTQWRSFLDGLKGGSTGGSQVANPLVPSVVSNVGAGSFRTINRVQCGDVLDYMGSRRNRLIESRTTSATFN